jgi:outer membrane receptor protein involved in Fe transport
MYLHKSALILALFIIFFHPGIAQAQQPANKSAQRQGGAGQAQGFGVISGILQDESSKQPVEYASVAIYKQKDSTLLTGVITDAKGRFLFQNLVPGKYYLKASFIGYEEKKIPSIIISAQTADIRLGVIDIKPQQATLEGVEIVGKKSLITNNLDKKVINVDKTLALSGGTAADVMENVPSVAVDADGNVSLRGNSNITLLIDGKPASAAGISSSDILNQLPASSIESVEVITNPSVRYDPDGTSGIINIVLKKKALQGFNGLVSATVGTNNKYNGSLNLNYRANKVNLFVGADARYNINKTSSESERTSTFGEQVNKLYQSQNGNGHRNSLNISGGIDYFINSRNNITLSVQKRNMEFGQEGDMVYRNFFGDDSLTRHFDRYSDGTRAINSMNYTLSYKHTFTQKGREFTQDIVLNDNTMDNTQHIDQQEYNILTGLPEGNKQKQFNQAGNTNYFLNAQGNYIHPLVNGARIETGYKFSYRDLNMDYIYNNFNYLTQKYEEETLLRNNYSYQEQLYALYGIFSHSIKKLKYQAGLRYEFVTADSKVTQSNIVYNKPYHSLYPSLHLQYDIGKGRELQLSYSRRVDRPSPREMNPYIDFSDSLNIRQGNPNLNPEYTNSVELGMMKYWDKASVTVTAFFRNTTGMVEDITRIEPDGVTYSMPENINNSKSTGIESVTSYNPAKWLRLMANLSIYQYVVSDLPEYNIEGTSNVTWSARLNASLAYSKNGALQLIGNYMAPNTSLQSQNKANYSVDATLRHDFLKNKLTATLRLTDVFDTRRFNSTVTGANFVSVNKRYMESRVLYAGLQFRINNYNKKAEKERLGSEMQDEGF